VKWLWCCLLLIPLLAGADAPSRNDAFAAKDSGNYAEAARLFAQLLEQRPEDAELWFQYGLVLRFAGRLEDAMAAQTTAQQYAPSDLDIALEIARLHFYRGDVSAANHQLQQLRARSADYPGAAELQHQLDAAAAGGDSRRYWWFALSHEWSRFRNRGGDPWQSNVAQITRALSEDLSAQVHLERAERYDNADEFAALNLFYRISPVLNVAGGVGKGIHAEYLPNHRVWVNVDWRVSGTAATSTAIWLAANVSQNRYRDLTVNVAKPMLRIEYAGRFDWSLQTILVDSDGAGSQTGWAARMGWNWQAAGWRFDGGYSDAPETEESITIDTRAVFIGARWQLSPATALALSLAREERERGLTRDIANLALILRY